MPKAKAKKQPEPAPIIEAPVVDVPPRSPKKFWMVFVSSGRPPKKRHSTLAKAIAEAKRIAGESPGVKAYALEALGYATTGAANDGGTFGPVEMHELEPGDD